MNGRPADSTHVATHVDSPRADTISIAARVDSIDRYSAAHRGQVRLFAQLPGESKLVPVKDSTQWPENTETAYNILFDSLHRPLLHVTSPVSESGDWSEEESHYFGPDGRTIFYDLKISGFGSGCTDVLREEQRVFFDPRGRIISQTRRFTDEDDKPISADSCYRRSDSAPAPKLSASDLPFPDSPDTANSASAHR